MIPLHTERLFLRNWEDRDRDVFHEINSDDTVMEFFHDRLSRQQSDAKMDMMRAKNAKSGLGKLAIERRDTGECIGTCGLAVLDLQPIFPAEAVEIGWRLARRFWGNGYVTEAARHMLCHGFKERGLEEIIAFTVVSLLRSRAVMERLGMQHDVSATFEHPAVPDSFSALKTFVTYRMTLGQWRRLPH